MAGVPVYGHGAPVAYDYGAPPPVYVDYGQAPPAYGYPGAVAYQQPAAGAAPPPQIVYDYALAQPQYVGAPAAGAPPPQYAEASAVQYGYSVAATPSYGSQSPAPQQQAIFFGGYAPAPPPGYGGAPVPGFGYISGPPPGSVPHPLAMGYGPPPGQPADSQRQQRAPKQGKNAKGDKGGSKGGGKGAGKDSRGGGKGKGASKGEVKEYNKVKVTLVKRKEPVGGVKTTAAEKMKKINAKREAAKPPPPPAGPPGSTAYIYYMPFQWKESDVELHFSHCGTISSVEIGKGPDGKRLGYGWVNFASGPASVLKAIMALDNYNAGPKNRLQIQPKEGEEHLVPPVPELDFPTPANPFAGPAYREKEEPGSTVFVFYVPKSWSDVELFITFIHFGDIINARVQTQEGAPGDAQSRGFGFVSFVSKLSAARAIKAMNGFNTGFKQRLQVSVKKGDEEAIQPTLKALEVIPDYIFQDTGASRGIAVPAGKAVPAGAHLFVHHLPPTWTEDELRLHFKRYGTILSLKIARGEDGSSRCFGFVGYESAHSAKDAIGFLDGKVIDGKHTLMVKLKDEGKGEGKGNKGSERAKPY